MAVSTATAADHGDLVETTVGLEAVYYARLTGAALVAKPVDEDAAVILRIADVVQDGPSNIYELRFVGSVAGRYDLRDYLLRADGQPLAELQPMEVLIGELLPAEHDGALEKLTRPEAQPRWRYRLMLAIVAALWLAIPVWWMIRRIARRKPKPPAPVSAEPSLADQLRPLVEAAVAGRLASAEQARLELLLIAHWRQRLDLTGCSTGEALVRMRGHADSGELLNQLEQWLHRPPGDSNVDVAAVLQPYRDCAPVDSSRLAPRDATHLAVDSSRLAPRDEAHLAERDDYHTTEEAAE